MTRFRYRLARWLIGPFVNIPERDGVWIVQRIDGGTGTLLIEADRFRLKMVNNLRRKVYDDSAVDRTYGLSRRTGRFVGTVKYGV